MFYYGIDLVDVIQGRGPAPSLVVSLVLRLPDTSLTAALIAGDRKHFGWGADRHIQADIFDALNQNTRATGQWGKKGPPKVSPYPRPVAKKAQADEKPVTVADLYRKFTRR